MHKLILLDHTGHTTLEWDPTIEAEQAEAAALFGEIIRHNFAYAATKEAPGKYEQIREFDPNAEEIIVRGPLVGG